MIELPVIDAAEVAEPDKQDTSLMRFWRSPSHREQEKEFKKVTEDEFMPGASKPPSGTSRRKFMQIMGASMALAGLSACRKPVEEVLPYTRKPEAVIPGIPRYFATAMPLRGSLQPLLVESHEERPTKVEGNPDHPLTDGGSSVFAQASILNLYDPDRSDHVLREGSAASWQDVVEFSRSLPDSARVAVLSEPTSSPTMETLREQLGERFADLTWISYAPEGDDVAELGMQQAFGRPLRPMYQFDEAEVIVSLDANFLGATAKNDLYNASRFAETRRLDGPEDEMSRLYVVESTHSVTGGMADNRLRLRASQIPAFAAALASELGVGGGAADLDEKQQRYIREIARDLSEAGSRGLVLAGDTQPPAIHALCAAINDHLGSIGETMLLLDTGESAQDAAQQKSQAEELEGLVRDMRAGQVDLLLMLGTNPVYNAPAELDFAAALEQVPESVHLGLFVNETAAVSSWHLPQAHYLEAWGDGRSYDGTLSVIQPLIAPLYDPAHSEVEVLNVFATGLDRAGYDLVREEWQDHIEGDFDATWRRVLHNGFLPDTAYPTVNASAGTISLDVPQAPIAEDELEVVFRLDPTVLAGHFSNNAWCQELPSPITKITWDNVAVMSPATAEALGIAASYEEGQYYVDVIELTVNEQSIEIPAWVLPGHPDGSIGLTFGYGRTIESEREERNTWFFNTAEDTDVYGHGPLANGVGVNVAPLRPSTMTHVMVGAQVRKTGETYMIATTQNHGTMEGRPIIRMASMEEYQENPDFATDEVVPIPGKDEEDPELWNDYATIWEEDPSNQPAFKGNPYYENQWGMAIDLNTCTGCSACVVACHAENNVPVVGKEEVSRGRDMHWLRIDRYFATEEDNDEGEADDPHMVVQPMMCVHCENAPCESVCPVSATTHSPDGINEMTYNRCIGTRYCSNNCPYKVRRFNFFNWTTTLPMEIQMAQNPEVTVRSRGVMEKCTYCVQRVRHAQRQANVEEREIGDGDVQTACAQACPTDAITFGDLNDPDSAVLEKKRNSRRYELLAELNTQPRTSYLARVRNPNSRLRESGA